MAKYSVMVLVLTAIACASCRSSRPVTAPGVATVSPTGTHATVSTNTMTPRQIDSVQRVAIAAEKVVQDDKNIPVWRKAIAERTRAVVAAGITNLDQVKKLVCEQTAAEEASARKAYQKNRQAFADLGQEIGMQAAAELPNMDPELLKSADAQAKEAFRKSWDQAFTKKRDQLIEECFRKSTRKDSKQDLSVQ